MIIIDNVAKLVITNCVDFHVNGCFFVCVDALHPSQQFFSHVGTISYLPGLNQY